MDPVRLTRKELFDIVWATPMSKLATRFGISDVALAKTCRNNDIPTPGRGYWAQLAAGAKASKPKLPVTSGDPGAIVFRQTRIQRPESEAADLPVITISDRLEDPHPAVEWLQGALKDAKPDQYGRLVVGPDHSAEARLCKSSVPRALRLLDAVCKALTARGHRVEARLRGQHATTAEISVFIGDEDTAIVIEEKLDQAPHILTKAEEAQKARGGWYRFPKYDYSASGHIAFKLPRSHYVYTGRKSWSDTKNRRLEDQLAQMVLGIEEEAEVSRQYSLQIERDQQARLVAERRRLRGERLEWCGEWLTSDLEQMTSDWELATRVRAFLNAYEEVLPATLRSSEAETWLAAIRAYVEQIDPIRRPEQVAKSLDPSDDLLEELIAEEKESNPSP